ncbi:hypothetical protein TL16_g12030 [Triparma laevis f. inornata]|uniref:Tetratricopeptide repeat protein n=1 Tax=Triparma laevis f. inornata TaxID=1714386 RepID=A0A9W7ESN3_9STRA|nr:hypothetical protein TL16_g12030 [Triparma laevis f. inornata]
MPLLAQTTPISSFSLSDLNPFVEGTGPDPTDAEACHQHGINLAIEDKTEESLQWFEKAVQLEPMDVRLMNDLAVTMMRLGKLDEARTELERAGKLDSGHQDVKNNLAAVMEHLNFRDLGVEPDRGQNKKQVDPDDDEGYRPGLFRDPNAPQPKKKKAPQPKVEVDDSIPSPENAAKARSTALDYAMADKIKEALPWFEKAVELSSNNAFYLSDLGVTYLRLGMLEESRDTLMKAQKLEPEDQGIRDNLAALQQHLDHREQVKSDKEAEQFAANILEVPVQTESGKVVNVNPNGVREAGLYDDADDDDEEEEERVVEEEVRPPPTRPKKRKEEKKEEEKKKGKEEETVAERIARLEALADKLSGDDDDEF